MRIVRWTVPRAVSTGATALALVGVVAAWPSRLAAQVRAARPAAPPPVLAPGDTLIAGADLQADVDLLARAEAALHPGLYRYQSPAAWAARVAALRRDVAGGMGQRAFYLRLAELTAAVRCGHSYPNFFNQRPAVRARVLESARRLPFRFRWLGDTMVVTGAPSAGASGDGSGGLPPGTRVTAIDGTPAGAVLARLLPLARADGGNDAKRREVLAVTGGERYEAFDVYYPLLFPLGESTTLSVVGPGAGRRAVARGRTVRVATQTFAEREAARAAPPAPTGAASAVATAARADTAPNPLAWSLGYLGDGTAVLTMPSWAAYEHAGWDWRAWLDGALAAVRARDDGRGAPRLVVDLRENEGGDDAVQAALLAALARRPVPLVNPARYVRYRALPPDLRPYADTWDRGFDDWSAQLASAPPVRGPGGVPLLRLGAGRMGSDTTVVRPAGPPITARVAVLVGPVNSSSTFAFAEAVRRSGLALLVGQPTGGNRRGINGGGFYFFRLPRSGIEVDIPLVGYYPPGVGPGPALARVPDGGLAPDVAVAPAADDLERAAGDAVRADDRTLAAAVAALRRPARGRP